MGIGERILHAMKRFTGRVASVVTAALLAVGLWLAYWVAIPLTRAMAEVFARGFLGRGRRDEGSHWRPAKGYGTTPDDVVDQS
ncbi:MAG TPA: hypothetical protein PLQ97_10540 [Myxococcota bacterium]|nr:hypothetical protein [Myxococcota bacterium]HQK51251.1 hypothetical protein [Myxococcota bacterium]